MGFLKPSRGPMFRNWQTVLSRAVFPLFVFMLTFAFIDDAWAGSDTLQDYAAKTGAKTNVIVDIVAYICFIIGAVMAAVGINELRRVGDGGSGQTTTMRHPLTKLGFGGIFLSLPFITGVLSETLRSDAYFLLVTMTDYTFNGGGTATGGIGSLIANGVNNTAVLIDVAGFISFLVGVWFTARGLQMLKDHIDNPSGQNPAAEAIKRLFVGGISFSLPMVTEIVYRTVGADQTFGLATSGWSVGGVAAGGLDGMMINFIQDLANPAYLAIEVFCYIAGILMVLFALQRLVKTAQDGPRGPLGFGTVVMFFVAGALLSFPQLVTVLDNSLLATGAAKTQVDFMALGSAVDPQQVQNAKNVFSAVIAFMAVVGFLSVVRGLFLLKAFADGNQQASMMSVVTHIVAGSIAINLGAFINAVQTSLGITNFAVTFT